MQQAQAQAAIIQKLQEQNARLSEDLKALDIPVAHTANGIKLTLTENVLRFASGEATLNDQARTSLKRIAGVLGQEAYRHRSVRVIGHTDSQGNNHRALSTARAQSVADSNIRISQIYTHGGEAGAAYQNDFIELYNRGNTLIDINGWTLNVTSFDGSQVVGLRFLSTGSVPFVPRTHMLFIFPSGGPNGVPAAVVDGPLIWKCVTRPG